MKRDDRLILLTRATLWPLAVLSAIFGPMLFFFPSRTDILWSWQIRPDMSAVVVGAGYVFGAFSITTLLLKNQWHALNIAIWGTWLFSIAMLLATLIHLDRFFVGTLRFYIWFIVYLALPFALPVSWWLNRRTSTPRQPEDLIFGSSIRYIGLVGGLLFLGFGLFMFMNPPGAATIWPWQLTSLMSRVLGGWVMFIGAGAAVIYFEPRYSAYRALLPSLIVWDIALLVGSLLHLDNFDFTRTSSWVWFLYLILATLGTLVLLGTFEYRHRQRTGHPVAPTTA
ncbi:MAG TPA: hypothetical protein VK249_32730 [Anaerolineales bacterium]|nr:hypothetical protein [Anaerolineales bacterium]